MQKKHLIGIVVIVLAVAVLWRGRALAPASVSPTPTPDAQAMQYKDLIRITSPVPGATIASPVVITGMARGTWYFEASFPVVIVDWDGKIIGQGIAQAQSDWMTTEYVPFKATITYTQPTYKNNGWIILRKDNPSGLSEHDDAFEVPILFGGVVK